MFRPLRIGLVVSGLAFGFLSPSTNLTSGETPQQIADWINELGSNDYRVREAAARNLKKCPKAFTQLAKAKESIDPEVSARAMACYEAIRPHLQDNANKRISSFVRNQEFDLAIEGIVHYPAAPGSEPNNVWQFAADIGWAVRDECKLRYGLRAISDGTKPDRTIAQYRTVNGIQKVIPSDSKVVDKFMGAFYRGGDLKVIRPASFQLLASSGRVDTEDLYGRFVLTNGPVRVRYSVDPDDGNCVSHSVILANGDVEFIPPSEVLVCRGR